MNLLCRLLLLLMVVVLVDGVYIAVCWNQLPWHQWYVCILCIHTKEGSEKVSISSSSSYNCNRRRQMYMRTVVMIPRERRLLPHNNPSVPHPTYPTLPYPTLPYPTLSVFCLFFLGVSLSLSLSCVVVPYDYHDYVCVCVYHDQ